MRILTSVLVKIIAYIIVLYRLPGILFRIIKYEFYERTDSVKENNSQKETNEHIIIEKKQIDLDVALYDIIKILPKDIWPIGNISQNKENYIIKLMCAGDIIIEKIVGDDISCIVQAINDFYVLNKGRNAGYNYNSIIRGKLRRPKIIIID